MNAEPPSSRFAGNPERLDREGLLALVRDLQRTVALQQQTIEQQRTALGHNTTGTAEGETGAVSDPLAAAPPANGGEQRQAPMRRKSMAPVAGADYTLVFDGGSLGNPGRGYGSYQVIDARGAIAAEERLEFGDGITNNGAEFRSLIVALEHLLRMADDNARRTRLAVRGDSQLVIHGVTGQWKIKHADLKPLRERAAALLGEFGSHDVAWHGRDRSVRALGH